MMIGFFSQALGCRVNQAEKIAIDQELLKNGFFYTSEKPDLFILNTCTVTHKADRESRQIIYKIKKKFPQVKIVVTGCAATYWLKEKWDKKLNVDLIVDNQNKNLLVKRILLLTGKPRGDAEGYQNLNFNRQTSKNLWGTKQQDVPFLAVNAKHLFSDKYLQSRRVIVKIQDGCHRFCSFCIVPYLRGLPKSVSPQLIVDEINFYQKKEGIKEVILTAINTEAYGRDINKSLVDLLDLVFQKTEVSRISFGSIHPWSIDEEFLYFYKKINQLNRLANFFHIPLQSGSDRVLRLMKRGYEIEEFKEKLMLIKKINQDAFLATDVIVGFLDETEKDFEETRDFLEKSPLVRFHVFRYSPRKGTAAYYLGKRLKEVDEKTKTQRAEILRDLSTKKYHLFLQSLVGKKDKVLILNKKVDKESYQGLLSNQIPIVVRTEKSNVGKIIPVKVEVYQKNQLFGKIIY